MEYEADGNEKAATAVIAISKSEATSDAFQEIQGVLKPRAISSLNYIKIDDEDNSGKIKALHDKDKMEVTMMKTFQAKFMEVYDTHMVHEPFISMSGPDGLAKDADNLLSGDLDIPACIHPDIVEVLTFIKIYDKIMNSDQVRLDTRFK